MVGGRTTVKTNNERTGADASDGTTRRRCWTRWTLDNVLKAVPAIALSASALSGLYIYATNGKDKAEAELKAITLTHETARLAHESVRLQNEQQRNDLEYSTKPRLNVKFTVLEPKIIAFHGDARNPNLVDYLLIAKVEIKNESEVPAEVRVAIMDLFLGTLDSVVLETSGPFSAGVINRPPGRWGQGGRKGLFDWKLVASVGGVAGDGCPAKTEGIDDVEFVLGDVGASGILPGGVTLVEQAFRVRIPPTVEADACIVLSMTDCQYSTWWGSDPTLIPILALNPDRDRIKRLR